MSDKYFMYHISDSSQGAVKVARRQRVFDADRNRIVLANLARGKQDNGKASHAAGELLTSSSVEF